jgi:hypothetical protein
MFIAFVIAAFGRDLFSATPLAVPVSYTWVYNECVGFFFKNWIELMEVMCGRCLTFYLLNYFS